MIVVQVFGNFLPEPFKSMTYREKRPRPALWDSTVWTGVTCGCTVVEYVAWSPNSSHLPSISRFCEGNIQTLEDLSLSETITRTYLTWDIYTTSAVIGWNSKPNHRRSMSLSHLDVSWVIGFPPYHLFSMGFTVIYFPLKKKKSSHWDAPMT